MKLTVLINAQAGSVPESAEDEINSLAGELPASVSTVMTDAVGLRAAIQDCATSGCDVLAVWGGDGTIACALETIGREGPAILPLPGGTMNLLHRKVHAIPEGDPIDWRACLIGAVRDGKTMQLAAGRINDERSFYVGAMFGELAGLSRAREAIREGRPMAAVEQASDIGAFNLATSLAFHQLHEGETGRAGQATALAAFVPEKGMNGLDIGWIDPDSLAELAALGIEIAMGDWRAANGVEYHRWEGLRIFHATEDEIEATLDGEPVRLPSGTSVTFVPEAACVLAAPPK